MRIQDPLTNDQQDCLEQLRLMNRHQLRDIFKGLDPPSTRTLVGEYDAELLYQGGKTAGFLTRIAFGLYGPWTGKAFAPSSDTEGVGYNCFCYGGQTVDKLPLRTTLGPSRLDDGQSLIIEYHDLNRGIIRWLTGELREILPTVILGFGTFRPKLGSQDYLLRKIPFVMVGPRREYKATLTRVRLGDVLVGDPNKDDASSGIV